MKGFREETTGYTDGLNGHVELIGWLTGRGREENILMKVLYLKITLRHGANN